MVLEQFTTANICRFHFVTITMYYKYKLIRYLSCDSVPFPKNFLCISRIFCVYLFPFFLHCIFLKNVLGLKNCLVQRRTLAYFTWISVHYKLKSGTNLKKKL